MSTPSSDSQPTARVALRLGDSLFALEGGRVYRVGRGVNNDIRINHASVADEHCLVTARDGVIAVEDLQSEHGTLVDGQRIYKKTVLPGQSVQVGAIELTFPATTRGMPVPRRSGDIPLRHRDELSFADVMAEEIRRAPWFTLSIAIHALVFLLLFYFADKPPAKKDRLAALSIKEKEDPADITDAELPPEEKSVVEEITAEVELIDNLLDAELEDDPENDSFDDTELGSSGFVGSSGWMTNVTGGAKGILGEGTVGGGGFRNAVTEIRRSGLEIVFVFDSTISMQSILEGTKARISHMVEVLHALAPAARIGIVTYRDTDTSEEYLTRSVPLSRDVYRAINFTKVIEAGGGGDIEESVIDGLNAAIKQKWAAQARRVIVLIGDAPSHEHDERRIKSIVRRFASNGRSQVHAIVTSPYTGGRLSADTMKSFQKISSVGRGECVGFEDDDKVLQQVLSLAFGQKYRKNLDEVSRIIAKRRDKTSTKALDLVRSEDLEEIEARLRRTPVWDELVKALRKTRSRKVAGLLVRILRAPDFPEPGRQAAAHVLQGILALDAPPNDPERGGAIAARQAEALQLRIERQM